MSDDDFMKAEAEKGVRVALKLRGYGYDEFYDEMRLLGFDVSMQSDPQTFTIEVDTDDVICRARMSRFSSRGLDRAARQVRAQLEVEGVVEPW